MKRYAKRAGFTLVELGVVVAIVALVAAIAVQRFGEVRREASLKAAECDLAAIRDAIVGSPNAPGYLADLEGVPGFSPAYLRLANLLVATNLFVYGGARADAPAEDHRAGAAAFAAWDAAAGRGWRGPYLRLDSARGAESVFPAPGDADAASGATYAQSGFFPNVARLSLPGAYREESAAYGFPGEPALLDPWGNPYVLQIPPPQAFAGADGSLAGVSDEERFRYARVVSAGPDGVLSTPCYFDNTNATGSVWGPASRRASIFAGRPDDRGDDLVLFLRRRDRYFEGYAKEGDER